MLHNILIVDKYITQSNYAIQKIIRFSVQKNLPLLQKEAENQLRRNQWQLARVKNRPENLKEAKVSKTQSQVSEIKKKSLHWEARVQN